MSKTTATGRRANSAFNIRCCKKVWAALAALCLISGVTLAAAPDLTVSTNRFAVKRQFSYNLGPTGMRGWIYTDWGTYNSDLSTGCKPWQILITSVGTNTPAFAAGIQTNDVILGVQAGDGEVFAFTNNARKSMGLAIGAAEAADGVLKLLVNRYGVSTNQAYTLHLKLTNLAYAATAPYNCPKSARILADVVMIISNMPFRSGGDVGNPVLGLAKLAVGITNADVKSYANSICPSTGSLQPLVGYDSWGWAYKNIFLAEYYLLTGDTSVTGGIREYSRSLAEAQSMYGTLGHHFVEPRYDGTHGSAWGYGPMFAASVPPGISLVLAKKCSIRHPEIDPAIDRLGKCLSYYVGKGGLPYGEHEPEVGLVRANAGKPAMAAFFFGLQGNMPAQTEYFSRLNMAEYNGMECWHCGGDPNYIWDWIAANLNGPKALAARLAEMRWYVDLARRCDGSFVSDWYDQGGTGGLTVNYWDPPSCNTSYGLAPNSVYALLFSVPGRRIYLTGRNPNRKNMLSEAAISNAIWAGHLQATIAGFNTNELLRCFSEYDPYVRHSAAQTLATKPGSNTLVSTLIAMSTSSDPRVREASCQALGGIKSPGAIPALVDRLYDKDVSVRWKAAIALEGFGAAATAAPYLEKIMRAFIANGSLDQYAIDWTDPFRHANGHLAALLFAKRPEDTLGAPTNLFYQAVAVGLALPDGSAREHLARFILNKLTWAHVQALAPNIIQAAKDPPPADRMFGPDFPIYAIRTLAKYQVEEGISLAVRIADKDLLHRGLGAYGGQALDVLAKSYRGSARDALPALYTLRTESPKNPSLTNAIHAIENLPGPALTYFKSIDSVSVTPASLKLPASKVTLKCSVTDKANGIPSFTWSKVSGPGMITFSTNNSPAAANVTATFSAAGTYVIQMACVNKSILDAATWNWGFAPAGSQIYTNIIGAVYTNLTVTLLGPVP